MVNINRKIKYFLYTFSLYLLNRKKLTDSAVIPDANEKKFSNK